MRVDEHLIQQLAERLKQAVHDTRHIETAQIQIVGLEDVRRRAGNLWPELAARVRETSRDFIGQRVGPHDLVFPAGDGFLVVYAEAEGAPAKSQILQDELNAFYLGGENTQFLSVSVTHEQLIPTAVIERLSARSAPAGQSAALIERVERAGDVVAGVARQAAEVLTRLAQTKLAQTQLAKTQR